MDINSSNNTYEFTKKDTNFIIPYIIVRTKNINYNFNEIVKKKKDNNKINKVKNEIDKYFKNEWDVVKKITNPFEMIYLTNKQFKMYSLSLYEPISRSYFKMIEILTIFFKELDQYKKINTFHLAEGPGGFIEGFINFRNNKKDQLYGITLIEKNKNIPGWNKNNTFLNKQRNVNLITGVDNSGNLYNIRNHYYLIDKFKKIVLILLQEMVDLIFL